jgi:hypothetical protein
MGLALRVTGLAALSFERLPYRRWGITPRPEVGYNLGNYSIEATIAIRVTAKSGHEFRNSRDNHDFQLYIVPLCEQFPGAGYLLPMRRTSYLVPNNELKY